MLILAIDSATLVAGVALLNEEKLIKEEFFNYKKTHSETLMMMVDRVLRESECTIGQVDVFAVTTGPGSFTGLRIGLAAVNFLLAGIQQRADQSITTPQVMGQGIQGRYSGNWLIRSHA